MAQMRQPRTERKPEPPKVRFQERDLFILEALTKMRFLTTTQLSRLGFNGSRWAAHKRLRKLLDAGLVRVWLRNLSSENVYSLSRDGAMMWQEAQDSLCDLVIPRGLDGNLDHLLGINGVRIALAIELPEVGAELDSWQSDWELRVPRSRVIPDALFSIRFGERCERTFALELDNHTRAPRAFLKKILRYASHRIQRSSRSTDITILVVGMDARWVERYRTALGYTGLDPAIYFTTLTAIEEKGINTPIWRAPNRDGNLSLREMVSLPCRKEGGGSENPVSAVC